MKGEGENLQCCVLKNSLASTAKAYYFTPSLLDVQPLKGIVHPKMKMLLLPTHPQVVETCMSFFLLLNTK